MMPVLLQGLRRWQRFHCFFVAIVVAIAMCFGAARVAVIALPFPVLTPAEKEGDHMRLILSVRLVALFPISLSCTSSKPQASNSADVRQIREQQELIWQLRLENGKKGPRRKPRLNETPGLV